MVGRILLSDNTGGGAVEHVPMCWNLDFNRTPLYIHTAVYFTICKPLLGRIFQNVSYCVSLGASVQLKRDVFVTMKRREVLQEHCLGVSVRLKRDVFVTIKRRKVLQEHSLGVSVQPKRDVFLTIKRQEVLQVQCSAHANTQTKYPTLRPFAQAVTDKDYTYLQAIACPAVLSYRIQ
jgi:hypothetical protein